MINKINHILKNNQFYLLFHHNRYKKIINKLKIKKKISVLFLTNHTFDSYCHLKYR